MTEMMYEVASESAGLRLDRYLARMSGLSRSDVQRQIKEGRVSSSAGPVLSAHVLVSVGDRICFRREESVEMPPEAENLPLDILYEDDDMIVINKSRGMVVHSGAGNSKGTLVNALLFHCGESIRSVGDSARPGIVHRLDKDTSGVMVAAKTERAYEALQRQIAGHTAQRTYLALIHGQPEGENGTIRFPLGRSLKDRMKWDVQPKTGKPAVTHFRVLEFLGRYSWIACRLETGRTHQIRVHMAHIGHPIVNDPLYGYKKDRFPIVGQALHSFTLDLDHPVTGDSMHFEALLPPDMKACLDMARKSVVS